VAERTKAQVRAEEEETQKTKELPVELAFVVIIFLIRAGYYTSVYLSESRLYIGDMQHHAFILIFLLVALFYLISSVGLFLRKKFGYYLAWLLLFVDVVFSAGYLLYPLYALVGIPLLLFMIYALIKNENNIKKAGRVDKWVALGVISAVVLYFAFIVYAAVQPTPEEYYRMVSKEAREKGDWRVCDKLQGGWKRRCMEEFAVYKKAPSLCEQIPPGNAKDSCFFSLALRLNNFTLCDRIANEYEVNRCYGHKNG